MIDLCKVLITKAHQVRNAQNSQDHHAITNIFCHLLHVSLLPSLVGIPHYSTLLAGETGQKWSLIEIISGDDL